MIKERRNLKKITITNAYTWYNKGDAGILLGTINAIKKIFGEDIEINILSFTPEEDRKRYCTDEKIKNVYSNVLNPYPFKKSFIGRKVAIAKLVCEMSSNYIQFKLSKKKFIEKNNNLKVLNESDIIIVCGGGFLGGKKFNSLMHVYQMYINNSLKKPTLLWGTSIEPMKSKILKFFTDRQIKKLSHIFPREKVTNKYLEDIIKDEKYTLIPDMAFMLEDKVKEYEFITNLKKKYDLVLGITVREWDFPQSKNKEDSKKKYIRAIKETIEKYAKERNAAFVFIPQVIFEGDNDSIIAEKIKGELEEKYKKNFIIRKDDWSPIEIKSVISNFDLFIGTRMHSNIFATSMKIPTVAIAYEKKTNGIMETLGLEEFIVEIDTITSEEVILKLDRCFQKKRDVEHRLEEKIIEIRNNIIDKSKFIKTL